MSNCFALAPFSTCLRIRTLGAADTECPAVTHSQQAGLAAGALRRGDSTRLRRLAPAQDGERAQERPLRRGRDRTPRAHRQFGCYGHKRYRRVRCLVHRFSESNSIQGRVSRPQLTGFSSESRTAEGKFVALRYIMYH